MPFDWSIKIEGPAGQPAKFEPPDLKNVKGSDTVSWGNATDETHQPWETDAQHNPLPASSLSDPIPPQASSSPSWVVVGSPRTVYYRCKTHLDRQEYGEIEVTG